MIPIHQSGIQEKSGTQYQPFVQPATAKKHPDYNAIESASSSVINDFYSVDNSELDFITSSNDFSAEFTKDTAFRSFFYADSSSSSFSRLEQSRASGIYEHEVQHNYQQRQRQQKRQQQQLQQTSNLFMQEYYSSDTSSNDENNTTTNQIPSIMPNLQDHTQSSPQYNKANQEYDMLKPKAAVVDRPPNIAQPYLDSAMPDFTDIKRQVRRASQEAQGTQDTQEARSDQCYSSPEQPEKTNSETTYIRNKPANPVSFPRILSISSDSDLANYQHNQPPEPLVLSKGLDKSTKSPKPQEKPLETHEDRAAFSINSEKFKPKLFSENTNQQNNTQSKPAVKPLRKTSSFSKLKFGKIENFFKIKNPNKPGEKEKVSKSQKPPSSAAKCAIDGPALPMVSDTNDTISSRPRFSSAPGPELFSRDIAKNKSLLTEKKHTPLYKAHKKEMSLQTFYSDIDDTLYQQGESSQAVSTQTSKLSIAANINTNTITSTDTEINTNANINSSSNQSFGYPNVKSDNPAVTSQINKPFPKIHSAQRFDQKPFSRSNPTQNIKISDAREKRKSVILVGWDKLLKSVESMLSDGSRNQRNTSRQPALFLKKSSTNHNTTSPSGNSEFDYFPSQKSTEHQHVRKLGHIKTNDSGKFSNSSANPSFSKADRNVVDNALFGRFGELAKTKNSDGFAVPKPAFYNLKLSPISEKSREGKIDSINKAKSDLLHELSAAFNPIYHNSSPQENIPRQIETHSVQTVPSPLPSPLVGKNKLGLSKNRASKSFTARNSEQKGLDATEYINSSLPRQNKDDSKKTNRLTFMKRIQIGANNVRQDLFSNGSTNAKYRSNSVNVADSPLSNANLAELDRNRRASSDKRSSKYYNKSRLASFFINNMGIKKGEILKGHTLKSNDSSKGPLNYSNLSSLTWLDSSVGQSNDTSTVPINSPPMLDPGIVDLQLNFEDDLQQIVERSYSLSVAEESGSDAPDPDSWENDNYIVERNPSLKTKKESQCTTSPMSSIEKLVFHKIKIDQVKISVLDGPISNQSTPDQRRFNDRNLVDSPSLTEIVQIPPTQLVRSTSLIYLQDINSDSNLAIDDNFTTAINTLSQNYPSPTQLQLNSPNDPDVTENYIVNSSLDITSSSDAFILEPSTNIQQDGTNASDSEPPHKVQTAEYNIESTVSDQLLSQFLNQRAVTPRKLSPAKHRAQDTNNPSEVLESVNNKSYLNQELSVFDTWGSYSGKEKIPTQKSFVRELMLSNSSGSERIDSLNSPNQYDSKSRRKSVSEVDFNHPLRRTLTTSLLVKRSQLDELTKRTQIEHPREAGDYDIFSSPIIESNYQSHNSNTNSLFYSAKSDLETAYSENGANNSQIGRSPIDSQSSRPKRAKFAMLPFDSIGSQSGKDIEKANNAAPSKKSMLHNNNTGNFYEEENAKLSSLGISESGVLFCELKSSNKLDSSAREQMFNTRGSHLQLTQQDQETPNVATMKIIKNIESRFVENQRFSHGDSSSSENMQLGIIQRHGFFEPDHSRQYCQPGDYGHQNNNSRLSSDFLQNEASDISSDRAAVSRLTDGVDLDDEGNIVLKLYNDPNSISTDKSYGYNPSSTPDTFEQTSFGCTDSLSSPGVIGPNRAFKSINISDQTGTDSAYEKPPPQIQLPNKSLLSEANNPFDSKNALGISQFSGLLQPLSNYSAHSLESSENAPFDGSNRPLKYYQGRNPQNNKEGSEHVNMRKTRFSSVLNQKFKFLSPAKDQASPQSLLNNIKEKANSVKFPNNAHFLAQKLGESQFSQNVYAAKIPVSPQTQETSLKKAVSIKVTDQTGSLSTQQMSRLNPSLNYDSVVKLKDLRSILKPGKNLVSYGNSANRKASNSKSKNKSKSKSKNSSNSKSNSNSNSNSKGSRKSGGLDLAKTRKNTLEENDTNMAKMLVVEAMLARTSNQRSY